MNSNDNETTNTFERKETPLKKTLYDGNTKINKIAIFGMYRNDEKYLTFLLSYFRFIEDTYDVEFVYYFIENNSTDNTQNTLKEFIKNRRNSKLILFNLKKDYKNIGDGRNYDRISNLAKIRNKLVDNVCPINADWSLFIDSNIYFPQDILEKIFNNVKPSEQNIGMMTMYTQQLFIPEIHKINSKEPALIGHYYDTYPFFDKYNKSHYPHCAFEKCNLCSNKRNGLDRKVISKSESIVDVNSAFGGFVLIQGTILNNPKIRWSTYSYQIDNDQCLCEHLLFCEKLRSYTDKRIVVLQDIDNIYRTF